MVVDTGAYGGALESKTTSCRSLSEERDVHEVFCLKALYARHELNTVALSTCTAGCTGSTMHLEVAIVLDDNIPPTRAKGLLKSDKTSP